MTSPKSPQNPTYAAEDDDRLVRTMAAVRALRRERMTQQQLADKLGVPQTYVSRWETNRPPRANQIADIEKALGVPAGTILRHAGLVDDVVDVESAIQADPNLTDGYRAIVLAAYRSAVEGSKAARQ